MINQSIEDMSQFSIDGNQSALADYPKDDVISNNQDANSLNDISSTVSGSGGSHAGQSPLVYVFG